MAYPTLEKYNQAFSAHSQLLGDPELRAGTIATSGLGLPLAISGGFALTYTVSTGRGKFAVRCFHRESKGLELRYAAISRKLAALRSPYFLDFQFQPQGIRVDGASYPVVKMAWASGITLGQFLEDNLRNTAALGRLADALTKLAAYLQQEGIAHGDLQSGNLMVSRDGSSVQLIDYDGMFVPEIKDLGSAELGHVNFQHPQRKSLNPFDASLDRFSLIALSVSLRALQVDATLWDRTNSEADAILFRANDFLDPASSSTFALLTKHSSLANYVKNFAAVCKSPMAKTPDLAEFWAGQSIPGVTIVSAANLGLQGYVGAYSVLAATDYSACQKAVGDKVEVIGRIVEVKQDKTRGGKPYTFINFGPWRGKIFKVAIWSDGFAHMKSQPDASWIGKWVSVVGLMEPPYENKKYRYSHLAISIGPAATMTLISEQEAQWRLAGAGKSAGAFIAATTSNLQTLDQIRSVSRAAPSPSSPAAPSPTASSNAQVLQEMRASYASQPVIPPPAPTATNSVTPPPPSVSSGNGQWPVSQKPNVLERFLKWFLT